MIVLLLVAVITAVGVAGYRQIALRRHWFDIPNQRSSHTGVVPRGAGIVFGAILLIVVALESLLKMQPLIIGFSILPGCAIAAAGWCDDLRGLSARWRLCIYAAACLLSSTLVVMSFATVVDIPVIGLFAGAALLSLGLLWWVNLYNFMDGINGIAALEAIFIASAALWLDANTQSQMTYPFLIAAMIGFLPWNFPRARVFMGDAGSAFLGFLLGVLALWSIANGALNVYQWLILAGVFIVDASYTLIVRMVTGQRWREAHRSHAYQRLADRCGSHVMAVALLMALNVFWLLPWAWLVRTAAEIGWAYLLVAYMPLLIGCWRLRAGLR